MAYISLIIYFIISILVLLYLHKGDILNPSVILFGSFLFCCLFGLFNWELWNLNDFSSNTTLVIVSVTLIFAVVNLFVEKVGFKNRKHISKGAVPKFNLPFPFLLLNTFVCFITILWYAMLIKGRYGTIFVGNSGDSASSLAVPAVLNVLSRYVRVQAYFHAVFFANRLICKKIDLSCVLSLFFSFSYSFISMMLSSRMELLRVLCCMIVALVFFFRRSKNIKLSKKSMRKLILILCVFLFGLFEIFYLLRQFKPGGSLDSNFLSYMSMYISAPIKLFDMYLQDPISTSGVFGGETFVTLNYNLKSLGFLTDVSNRHLEFRGLYNTVSLGNVYGAQRRFYNDFGMFGAVFLTAVESVIISVFYKKAKRSNFNFSFFFYCFIFGAIVLYPIDDVFFSELSFGYIGDITIFYLIYYFIIKSKKNYVNCENASLRRVFK